MLEDYQKTSRNFSLSIAAQKQVVSDLFFSANTDEVVSSEGENIVIVGGELFNKGAQAMTFTVVDQMRKRFPEKDIYLFSRRDFRRSEEEKSQYSFEILPWGPELKLRMLSSSLDYANTNRYSKEHSEKVADVLSNCAGMIDINGYALSSQMGFDSSLLYMLNIAVAKKWGIPMYLLPQSIGPFDYSLPKQLFLNPLLELYLPYPEVVCAREKAGVESLRKYTHNNVSNEFDLVLQAEQYDLENVYAEEPDLERKEVADGAVAIVPNSKVFERMDETEFYALYEGVISKLLSEGHTVYVFRHSVEDLDLCQGIKSLYPDDERVVLFEDDLNAIELEHVIDQCQFLVGSRYHSLIHSYKNHVPVLAIGWATKYKELLEEFEQIEYFFDCRAGVDETELSAAIASLSAQHSAESELIQTKVDKIQENSIFDRQFPVSESSSETSVGILNR